MSDKRIETASAVADEKRRVALKRIGRFAAVTPPTVALLLAARSRPAKAVPIYQDADDANQ